jgi:Fe-S-cluster containining protein
MCTVYDDRPDFCRVEPQKFKAMYGIEEDELNVRVLYDSTMNCIG